jgi:6-pyruvoyltetrahydropterin/6-carboxytetrahydropterin synthase
MEIPMGHRLMQHKGKCRFLHGHNYSVASFVQGTVDKETGMVIDFHDLKQAMHEVFELWDHSFVLQEGDNILREVDQDHIIYIPYPPTAENLASIWADQLSHKLNRRVDVDVYETRDSRVML